MVRLGGSLSSSAQSAGVSVSATMPESTTAIDDRDGELLEHLARDAAEERHRQEHGAEHQHDRDQRAGHLADRLVGGEPRRQALGRP